MIFLADPDVIRKYEDALSMEWIETNGLGGFASGTVAGPATRRYHGLLTAALKPPQQRRLLLAGLDEFVRTDKGRYALSAHEFPGVVHPDGHSRLVGFRQDPWPIWTYQVEDFEVEREVFMVHGEHTVVVRYRSAHTERDVQVEIRPFLAYRDFHALSKETDRIQTTFTDHGGILRFQPTLDLPALHFGYSSGSYRHDPDWYRSFDYRIEKERGLDYSEDLFTPGSLNLKLGMDRFAGFVVGLEQKAFADSARMAKQEIDRREKIAGRLFNADDTTRRLCLTAHSFLVKRGDQQLSVMAGYPWFGNWGRDTLIALPGLCLTTERYTDARDILRTFAKYVDQGMVPNRFPEEGEKPEYNTIDASLWFFYAVRKYVEASADRFFLAEIVPVLEQIIQAHLEGTRYGIKADDDGLLMGGEEGVQLTWMDAKVGDWVVTPRRGKAVEINALWYNALRIIEDFEKKTGRPLESMAYMRRADRVKRAFAATFWNDANGCLFDVIDAQGQGDPAIRPNQLFAISLPYRLLSPEQERSVLDVVTEKLLTPVGLRSLAPGKEGYGSVYQGGPLQRDGCYHQGTVWSWLIGAYVDAYLAVHGRSYDSIDYLRGRLEPLVAHMDEVGIGSVSEIFDADYPHRPRGCFSQAWSVAELLRVWRALEDQPTTPSGLWKVIRT